MPTSDPPIANPPPPPSNLPSTLIDLSVRLSTPNDALTPTELQSLRSFRRAADYIAAAMIFLRSNTLLSQPLTHTDIKPRILGHWGTCPGLTLVYAHLNRIVSKWGCEMMFVIGPGHGAPAILAALWLEGSLAHFYPEQYPRDKKGLDSLIKGFSTPGGFPSHINAQVPGSIHEGGELGYALSVAFGAVMDRRELIVPVVVGDGEAETGPTATAWHGYKYIDPRESGAILPIVHINGFKISERTIYGCMDDLELTALFTGYGYHPRFVSYPSSEDIDIDTSLALSLDWAISTIRHIQHSARSGNPIVKPRWPVILLRTPKGWGAPKKVHGEILEGSFHAHQVPLPKAGSDDGELALLQEWLGSYHPGTLFDEEGGLREDVVRCVPSDPTKRMGVIKDSFAGYKPLDVPAWTDFSVEKGTQVSNMQSVASLLDAVLQQNPTSMRIFSPDELESNKLGAVLTHTSRNFQWDQYSRSQGGRIIEMLSEHTCQGMMQGYTLTGRTALLPSYESFLGIIHTMMVQYSKFRKIGRETVWRGDTASLNYLETSTWARQEHNGHSHQNPSFIGAVLNLKPASARVYLPPDANCCLSTMAHILRSRNYTNLLVSSKQPTPVWLTPEEADEHCKTGASIWRFASSPDTHPDIVLCGIGTEVTFEVIAAASWLRRHIPQLQVRVVNVTDLMVLYAADSHPHALSDEAFEALFTADRNIHFNYHGYVTELQGLLFGRGGRLADRVSVEGYREEGSTTTPFDMMVLNHVSRWHVAMRAVEGAARWNEEVEERRGELVGVLEGKVREHGEYILRHGEDPEGTYDIPKFE